jgi:hypothetical protein
VQMTEPQPDPGVLSDRLAGSEQLFAKHTEVMHQQLADGKTGRAR